MTTLTITPSLGASGTVVPIQSGFYVRQRRRELAERVRDLATLCAAANYSHGGHKDTPLGAGYNGQIILDIGAAGGLWCDQEADQVALYDTETGDWSDSEGLERLRLAQLRAAVTHLERWLGEKGERRVCAG